MPKTHRHYFLVLIFFCCSQIVAKCIIFKCLRVVEKLEYTATENIIKRHLREESFDVKHISDPLYFLDPASKTYIPLTEEVYKKICDKEYKF